MNAAATLPPQHTEILAKAPLALFYAIGGSDGELPSAEEHERLKQMLYYLSQKPDGSLSTAIMHHTFTNLNRLAQEVLQAGDAGPLFAGVKHLLATHVHEEQRLIFLQELGWVAQNSTVGPDGAVVESRMALFQSLSTYLGYPIQEAAEWMPGDEHWPTLAQGIVATFILLAAIDGGVSKKELENFRRILNAAKNSDSETFAHQLLRYVEEHVEALLRQAATARQRGTTIAEMVYDSVQFAKKSMPASDSYVYRALVMRLAQNTAEADGGFMGFGSKINAKEREALEVVSELTGVPLTI